MLSPFSDTLWVQKWLLWEAELLLCYLTTWALIAPSPYPLSPSLLSKPLEGCMWKGKETWIWQSPLASNLVIHLHTRLLTRTPLPVAKITVPTIQALSNRLHFPEFCILRSMLWFSTWTLSLTVSSIRAQQITRVREISQQLARR